MDLSLRAALLGLALASSMPALVSAAQPADPAAPIAPALGRELREPLERGIAAARSGDLRRAAAESERVVAAFRALAEKTPGAPLISFASASEHADWLAMGEGRAARWADPSFGGALLLRAWVEVERARPARALAWLERARRRSPLRAEILAELGYVENRLQRPGRALRDYERALELSRHYPASADQEGRALRGIGYSLVQMGAFRRGYDAYRAALRVRSDDLLARGELEYLEELRRGDRLYRPASAREAEALASARRDLTPRDIQVARGEIAVTQVAWAGIVRGVEGRPASAAAGVGPSLVLEVEHRYFSWLESRSERARLKLSPEGEGLFEVALPLERGTDLDAARAGFEVGSMLIVIGYARRVPRSGGGPELALQVEALNLIDGSAWQVSRAPSR